MHGDLFNTIHRSSWTHVWVLSVLRASDSHIFWEQETERILTCQEVSSQAPVTPGWVLLPPGTWWGEETHPEWRISNSCPGMCISVSLKWVPINQISITEHCVPTEVFQNSKIRPMEVSPKHRSHQNYPQGLLIHRLLDPPRPTFLTQSIWKMPQNPYF